MCRILYFLYCLIPLPPLRRFLAGGHFADCPRCRKAFFLNPALEQDLCITPSWIETEKSHWPHIRIRLLQDTSRIPKAGRLPAHDGIRRWRWAVAGGALFLHIAAVMFFNLSVERMSGREEASHLQSPTGVTVNYAEIKGEKARPYIYQTSSKSFVWLKAPRSGGE